MQQRQAHFPEQVANDPGTIVPPATRDAEAESGVQPSTPTPYVDQDEKLPSLLSYGTTWRVLAWWTAAYGLASWILEYLFSQLSPSAAMPFLFGLNRVIYAVMWSAAILVAIVATEHWPITSRRQIGRILVHTAICLAISILWGVAGYYLCVAFVPGWQPLGVAQMLASTTKIILFGYGFVVLLVHIVLRMRQHREHEVKLLRQARRATEAQLQVLKMELQPHFLFNALHSISALIPSDPSAANDTLVLVSDMLRYSMRTSRVQEVPLRDELATVRLYTEIEQVRFGDRLDLAWEVDADTLDAAVPHMLLQPLIENAIKHGLEVRSTAGRIIVAAQRDGDVLRLTIRDDGPGIQKVSSRRGSGVGLANTRARLEELYKGRYTFTLSNRPQGGTVVTITLPFVPVRGAASGVPAVGDSAGDMAAVTVAAREGKGYAA